MSDCDPSFGVDAARIRALVGNLSCPLCAGTSESSLLVVVDAPGTVTTVRTQCIRCHLFWSFALDAEAPRQAVREAGPPPEGPITGDEMVELRRVLEGHQGSFEELLWPRAS